MAETVRVTGLAETRSAFRKAAAGPKNEFPKALRKVAEPVRQTTSALLAPYSSTTAAGVRSRVKTASVSVQQSLRKTTGDHPNYGGLQMRRGFLPALARNEREIIAGVEDMLDDIIRKAGF